MVILITGATHCGKTLLAQRLLEKYKYPYGSIDLLKMGLIRRGCTSLSPEEDSELTRYLWPILREIIKTALENQQNLIIEGAYIPSQWTKDFDNDQLKQICFCGLVMSPSYIENHFQDIKKHANAIEKRMNDDWYTQEYLIEENLNYLRICRKYGYQYILIDHAYPTDLDSLFQQASDNLIHWAASEKD